MACYLEFTEASAGSFFAHWSEEPVEGALAKFVPAKPIPKFKFKTHGGRSEICRGIAGGNKQGFYKGWASFVRQAFANNATFTFLKNAEANPVGVYLCKADTTVHRCETGAEVALSKEAQDGFKAVGVLHEANNSLSVQKMLPSLFISTGEKEGAAESL